MVSKSPYAVLSVLLWVGLHGRGLSRAVLGHHEWRVRCQEIDAVGVSELHDVCNRKVERGTGFLTATIFSKHSVLEIGGPVEWIKSVLVLNLSLGILRVFVHFWIAELVIESFLDEIIENFSCAIICTERTRVEQTNLLAVDNCTSLV